MQKPLLLAVLIMAGVSAVTPVRSETFSYKTTPLYSSIKNFKNNNPEFSCLVVKGLGVCTSHNSTYGEQAAKEIKAEFFNNKLLNVEITIGGLYINVMHLSSKQLLDGLTKKYGMPTTKDLVDDSIPAIKSTSSIWRKHSDILELDTLENKISTGLDNHVIFVRIFSKDYEKLSEKSFAEIRQNDL